MKTQATLWDPTIARAAVRDSLAKLAPRRMIRNPVMFVVEVGAVLTTALVVRDLVVGDAIRFGLQVALWLWFTMLFANFAEAMAEGRGKAQAESLRAARSETIARVRLDDRTIEEKPSSRLKVGDVCVVSAGQIIPGDGDVIEGVASVDESAITGESAPVIRESGGDRSAVTGGTRVLSDQIVVEITVEPGQTFLDRMIALVEGADRRKTPNEIALTILLAGLTLVFVLAVASLQPFAIYADAPQPVIVLVALLVTLIPTTIGGLLSAIGIAGMDRLVQRNVLAMSGRAVEAAGDCSTLLLDKTGTITLGDRHATQLVPTLRFGERDLAEVARLASLADETPEGRSIVTLAEDQFHLSGEAHAAELIHFSASTRMSGIDHEGRQIRKGAADAITSWVTTRGGVVPAEALAAVERAAASGATPLMVSSDADVIGVVVLEDVLKPGMKQRFDQLRRMGLRTVMVTGDNYVTARVIGAEAGVDDVLAEATPEDKMRFIRDEQRGGRLVAMSGDGTNDAPALAQADVGVAMNTGTQAAKEAANMVDLDSDPTKLIEIVEIGKQLLITRGSLTTFSIANDVAKYFAILPAMFVLAFPGMARLNIMGLESPESAILSAVIFNALIIIALIPLALRGVRYRAAGAASILRRNVLIYGLGGLGVPFLGIKVIDLVITALGVL